MIENVTGRGPHLRPGRRNPRTLYLQMGPDPDDTVDLPIGFFIDSGTAALIGEAVRSPWHLNEIRMDAEAREDEPRLETRPDKQRVTNEDHSLPIPGADTPIRSRCVTGE